jgi:hypothetical protein
MAKVMTVYLVFEAIANGEISYETEVPISENTYRLSRNSGIPNTVPLHYNRVYTVKEFLNIVIVYSASGATVALAELVSGTEAAFIESMNSKAQEMEIDAHFTAPYGAGSMSPRAMATLARNIISDYSEVLEFSAQPSVYFHGQTFRSTNLLLGSMYYEGADGLKTGTSSQAGYCFTSTAERNGVRLITVVMASTSTTNRYYDTHKLLNFGFSVHEELELHYDGAFRDVREGAWYYDNVMFVWEYGIMNGTSESMFSPNAFMTRAMAASVLYRIASEPDVSNMLMFSDVHDSDWYANAVMFAWQTGIIEGYEDGTFRPNENVTREQFATMLYRFAPLTGRDISARANLVIFTDMDEISDWALEAFGWAVATKIMTGTTTETLEPGAPITRAQCATMIARAAVGNPD